MPAPRRYESIDLDHDSVTVEILYDDAIRLALFFMDELGYPRATSESEIIEDDDTADRDFWPRPLQDILARLVNIHVNVADN